MSILSIRRQRLRELSNAVEDLRNAANYRARDGALSAVGLCAVCAQVDGVNLPEIRAVVGAYWASIAFPASLQRVA